MHTTPRDSGSLDSPQTSATRKNKQPINQLIKEHVKKVANLKIRNLESASGVEAGIRSAAKGADVRVERRRGERGDATSGIKFGGIRKARSHTQRRFV